MPYSNVPKELWPEMERCVKKVKAKGGVKNAYAVCFKSVVGSKIADEAHKRIKEGRRGKG